MRVEIERLIKLLHDDMQQLTIDAGVSIETYQLVGSWDETTPDVELEALHTWLQMLYENEYAAVVKLWKVHPRRRWEYYYQMGEYLAEIKQLNYKRRLLYAAWQKPYLVTRRKKRAEESDIRSDQK